MFARLTIQDGTLVCLPVLFATGHAPSEDILLKISVRLYECVLVLLLHQ